MLCTNGLSPKDVSCLKLSHPHLLSMRTTCHYLGHAAAQLQCGDWGRAAQECHRGWKSFFQRRHTCHILVDAYKPDPSLWKLMPASQFGSKTISCDVILLSTAPWGCHSPRTFCFYFRPPRGAWLCQRWDARTTRPSGRSWCAWSHGSTGTSRSQWTVWPYSVCLLCKPGCQTCQRERALACREYPQTCF